MKKGKKTVLLTGSSRGIGKAIYVLLKKDKFNIIAPDRKELDLSNVGSIDAFIKKNKKTRIDIIINNAGINHPQWVEEISDKNFNEILNVNLLAPVKLTGAFISNMKRKKWGRIVNISSIFGIVARGKQIPYVTSKHALNGMTKTLALELAKYNILVNSICPGFISTELVLQNSKKKITQLEKEIPLGRLGKPEEIANLVMFLISEKNTYMTGSVVVIDGGFIAK